MFIPTIERQIITYVTSEGEVSDLAKCDPCGRPRIRPPWCRVRYGMDFGDQESLVQQAHWDQTDVNAIVDRYHRTGILPPVQNNGVYADVTGLQGDLTERIQKSREDIAAASEFIRNWKPKEPEAPESPPANNNNPPAATS